MNGRWIELRDSLWIIKPRGVIIRTAFIGYSPIQASHDTKF